MSTTPDLFRPPLDHLIHRPKPYVPANQTDIRKTFARVAREAATENNFVLFDVELPSHPLPELTLPEEA